MDRSHLTLALLLTGAVAGACDRNAPVSPQLTEPIAIPHVNAPVLTPEDLEASTFVVREADPDGSSPALTEEPDGEDSNRPLQQIFDPETRVGFESGYAYALGRHDYIGNVGAVRTTAHVAHNNAYLGSQTSTNQDYTPFLLDWGQRKMIWTWARVYSDHECGLSVQGESKHQAWWQFYQGTGTAAWGKDIESTQASPESQACSRSTGETGSVTETGGGMVCHYLITYYLDTGEIVSAELLYCTTSGPMF